MADGSNIKTAFRTLGVIVDDLIAAVLMLVPAYIVKLPKTRHYSALARTVNEPPVVVGSTGACVTHMVVPGSTTTFIKLRSCSGIFTCANPKDFFQQFEKLH